MMQRLLTSADGPAAIELVRITFQQADGLDEAHAVSGLVARYFERFPRTDLLGFGAFEGDALIGCLFFSRLDFPESNVRVFLLSPMAVHPDFQGHRIGQNLIHFAHHELRQRGVQLTVTYGDPAYYSQTGFVPISSRALAAPHPLSMPQGWIAQSLDGTTPLHVPGPSTCVTELDVPELW
jgi:putative acetyltransferase